MKKTLLNWIYANPVLKQQYLTYIRPIYIKNYKNGTFRQWLHWLRSGHVIRHFKICRLLQEETVINLQVGGGYHVISGWLNGDIIAGDIYLDAVQPIPLPDNCIDYIFTEQFFEHISFKSGKLFLSEAYRILKPGGIIRQSTPSLEGLIDIYLDKNEFVTQIDAIQRHLANHKNSSSGNTACNFVNDIFRLWGHQFIYDRPTLEKIYKNVGFTNFQWKQFGESDHSCLQSKERHADVEWMKSAIVMICEASKPNKDANRLEILMC